MKLNSPNRAFLALVAASLVVYGLLGIAALVLVGLIIYQALATGAGPALLHGHDLRPTLAFLVLVGLGTVLGARSLRRQVRSTRELRRRVEALRVSPPPEMVLAASRKRIPRRRIDVVSSPEPFSFAYGLVLPRIVVSEGLLETVSPTELDAVLEHERYHVRNLDPLKVVLARVLPPTLFFLPALRDLKRRYVAGRELAADQRALDAHGQKALAGALLKVVRGPGWSELGAAAAIGGTDLLDVRISQLETGREPDMPGVSRLAAAISTIGLGVLVWSFAWAIGDVGGPVGTAVALVPSIGLHVGRAPFALGGSLIRLAFWAWIGWLVYHALRRRSRSRPPA